MAVKQGVAQRFRGFFPVVVDVETGGFNPDTDALLEIAAVLLAVDPGGLWYPSETDACHVLPFTGANLEPAALEFNHIDPYHPLRFAVSEREALQTIFRPVRRALRNTGCTRAVLVGHNPCFDLAFVNAAVRRTGLKRNPFHPFTTFDTATLGGLVFGQTVLSRAVEAAGLSWDKSEAHAARYDAMRTAELFCAIVNRCQAASVVATPGGRENEEEPLSRNTMG
jgi:ribonuclease T